MTNAVEPFPAWEYVEDMMKARRWSRERLAKYMGGDPVHNLCILNFLEGLQHDPRLVLGQVAAEKLAHAFGTSVELWLNLDASFHRSVEARKQQEP